ncbi:MAG TPA: hypothetical protein PLJ50_11165 [Candidatus Latescibacteria bacterium]|nr:hypothetical protein [Candidatus Latescibacterota bacterium]
MQVRVEDLEAYRDRLWCRLPSLRIHDEDEAVAYLERVPMCLAFGGYALGVPTMWTAACGLRKPVFPKHSHHDPAVGLIWRAKETLVHSGAAYYGRLFLNKPSFVARSWLATVLAGYPRVKLSQEAQAVSETLEESGPLPTRELGVRSGIRDRRVLTKALEEAQTALRVTKVEERSDPFTYVWGTLSTLYAQEIDQAKGIPQDVARRKIAALWVNSLGLTQAGRLARILGWDERIARNALADLVTSGTIVDGVSLEGARGVWVGARSLLQEGITGPAVEGKGLESQGRDAG